MNDPQLDEINQTLAARGLKSLSSRGDRTLGQIELLHIRWIYDHSARLFTDVVFDTLNPDGSPGWYTIRFNANTVSGNGAVVVVLVHTKGHSPKVALVRQWRPPLGRYTVEVPRGFRDATDTAGTVTASREMREEVLSQGTIREITHLGDFAELTGTHAVESSFFLLEVEIPQSVLPSIGGTEKNITTQLWSLPEIEADLDAEQPDKRQIRDSLSILALSQTLPYLRRRDRERVRAIMQTLNPTQL